jgi:hypothetical protein
MPALLTSMSIPQKQRQPPPYRHLRLVGDVHADADSAVHIAEFGRNSSGTRLIKISDDNFGACATEDARDFLAAPVTTATLLLRFMGSFFHLFCATDLGDMSEAGGALADVFVGQTVS